MILLKYVCALVCVSLTVCGCAPLPATPGQGAPSGLNAPPTPGIATAQLPAEQPVAITPDAPGGSPAVGQACQGLDSALSQIAASPDPVAQAAQMLVEVKDGAKIQVAMALSGPDTAFLSAYGVEVGSQSGNSVQALVPLTRLCDVADTEQVLAINLPAQAITQ